MTSDATQQIFQATPYDGVARPGKCVLSPEMKLLSCYTGPDNVKAFNAIKADAGL